MDKHLFLLNNYFVKFNLLYSGPQLISFLKFQTTKLAGCCVGPSPTRSTLRRWRGRWFNGGRWGGGPGTRTGGPHHLSHPITWCPTWPPAQERQPGGGGLQRVRGGEWGGAPPQGLGHRDVQHHHLWYLISWIQYPTSDTLPWIPEIKQRSSSRAPVPRCPISHPQIQKISGISNISDLWLWYLISAGSSTTT